MKKFSHIFIKAVILLFLIQLGGEAAGQTTRHRRKSTRKPLPNRPKNELILGEVTIYGESASLRMPKTKVAISNEPARAALLGWGTYHLFPPTELQSPELPALLSPEAKRVIALDVAGGSFQTSDSRLLFWKTTGHASFGLSGFWRNSTGTSVNRFYHQGGMNLLGSLNLGKGFQLGLTSHYQQDSFGFGDFWPDKLSYLLLPNWRKLHTFNYRVSLTAAPGPEFHWGLSYQSRFFPTDNAIDHPFSISFRSSANTHHEKTQILSGNFSLSKKITLHATAQAIFNRDRFPYYPTGLATSQSASLAPEGAFQNSQTFLKGQLTAGKAITDAFFARVGLNTYYFTHSNDSSKTLLKAAPVLSIIYTLAPRWQFGASYFSGYTFRTSYDVYRENPFYDQSVNLNQLEHRKVQARVTADWAASRQMVFRFGLSENVIQNYPVWESHLEWGTLPDSSFYFPGVFQLVYLPEVHFNRLKIAIQSGKLESSFLKVAFSFAFNKRLTTDSMRFPKWNDSNDVPYLPNLQITFQGQAQIAPKWRLEAGYVGDRAIEYVPTVVPAGTSYLPKANTYLPNYLLINARLRYLLPFGSIYVGLWNGLNQTIEPFLNIQDDGRKVFGGMEIRW
ncbi:MAG: hypothetical protein GXO76_00505 [Calditrichaeota bacterium]|nr:hypothetical protein [Calditrichota bacterium]